MYQEYKKTFNPNPKETASILSLITFFFSFDLFKKAIKSDIKEEDIYELQNKLRTKKLGDFLEKKLAKIDPTKKCVSVPKLIYQLVGKQVLLIAFVQLILSTVMILLNPYLISKIVAYFSHTGEVTKKELIYSGTIFIVVNILYTFYINHSGFWMTDISIKTKMALSSIIYRKSLKLSPHVLSNFTIGNIVTLLNKDVNYIELGYYLAIEFFIGIFHLGLMSYIIYQKLGMMSMVAIAVIIIIFFFHVFMGIFMYKKRKEAAAKTDKRMLLTQECLSAIKIVKMYTWEKFFSTKISQSRKEEIYKLKQIYVTKIVSFCMADLSLKIAFCSFVMMYIWMGSRITAETMYYLLSCFASLKLTVTAYFSHGIENISEMKAAMLRVQKLLQQEELPLISETRSQVPAVNLNDVSIRVNQKVILQSVTLKLTKGLNLIAGATGTGKTTLVKAILGEYETIRGKLRVEGSISYASQEPWVFTGSLRQNIIFGENYDENRFCEVLNVCALKVDLKMLDGVTISTGGTNISKGQQARITLARAIYRNSDIYLIDDCLSCLDINVQDEIFRKCIKQFLRDKVVVMISHNKKYIEYATNNIHIKSGFVNIKTSTVKSEEERDKTYCFSNQKNEYNIKSEEKEEMNSGDEKTLLLDDAFHTKSTTYKEINKEGVVDISMYKKYIKLGGGFIMFFLILSVFAVSQGLLIFNEKLINKWANIEDILNNLQNNKTTSLNKEIFNKFIDEKAYTLKWYLITITIMVVLYIIRSVSVFFFASTVCVNIHKILAKNVICSKMSVLDSHSIGNILNRFSKDLSTIDETLAFVIFYLIACFSVTVGVLVLVASTNTIFLVPTAILLLILYTLRRIYISAGRSLKRLDAATRSPIVGHLNDTLEGLSSIRAFRKQKTVTEEFDRHLDLYSSSYHMAQVALRAFTLYLELTTIIFISIVIITFTVFDSDTLAANVGMALTQSFQLTGLLRFGIVQSSELENHMTAVERVTEYSNFKTESTRGQVIENWPKHPTIIFQNVFLKYKKSVEYVLKNINFSVDSNEKIGIVGRTGSGKSSIISCLFKLYDFEGNIYIDGMNINDISLKLLRTKITIIPQDPVVFNGTLRDNIDPKNEYTDGVIYDALRTLEFDNFIKDLDENISDLKNVLSSGQKQLICLARALIQESKIVILDEATANMDVEKDESIHTTLRKLFSKCTVLIIAHRLYSVMNCDKIVVVDNGQVVEFDTPYNLLKLTNSRFNIMVQQSEFYT